MLYFATTVDQSEFLQIMLGIFEKQIRAKFISSYKVVYQQEK